MRSGCIVDRIKPAGEVTVLSLPQLVMGRTCQFLSRNGSFPMEKLISDYNGKDTTAEKGITV